MGTRKGSDRTGRGGQVGPGAACLRSAFSSRALLGRWGIAAAARACAFSSMPTRVAGEEGGFPAPPGVANKRSARLTIAGELGLDATWGRAVDRGLDTWGDIRERKHRDIGVAGWTGVAGGGRRRPGSEACRIGSGRGFSLPGQAGGPPGGIATGLARGESVVDGHPVLDEADVAAERGLHTVPGGGGVRHLEVPPWWARGPSCRGPGRHLPRSVPRVTNDSPRLFRPLPLLVHLTGGHGREFWQWCRLGEGGAQGTASPARGCRPAPGSCPRPERPTRAWRAACCRHGGGSLRRGGFRERRRRGSCSAKGERRDAISQGSIAARTGSRRAPTL